MGITFSQEGFCDLRALFPSASVEVQDSFQQIFLALVQEFALSERHPRAPVLSHPTINCVDEPENKTRQQLNRSHSLDENQPPQHHHPPSKSSEIRREWLCQLCHTRNQCDFQLCFECGSCKINVYKPVMNSNSRTKTKKHVSPSSERSAVQQRNKDSPVHTENSPEQHIHRRSVLIAHKREVDEYLVLKNVEKLIHTCRLAQSRFKDETFPASSHSLFINGHSLAKSTLALLPDQQQSDLNTSSSSKTTIQWIRPDKIVPYDWSENSTALWTIFRDPKPNDVLQGALGDCWFITALSVLAERPEYLMRVLVTQQYNHEGIYYVRLCKDGEWTQVLVDDRLPCTRHNTFAYSQAKRKQLWVPLIEKALAKLNGSYEAIIAGRCCEGLATVTGSPCETLILGRSNNPDDKNVDHDKLWAKLLHARDQRFLMCAMCSNSLVSKEEFERCGLLNVHAYSLQDVKQSQDGKHRLLKLRNPWGGTYRWLVSNYPVAPKRVNGDWSDDSPLWTENSELRRELLVEKRSKRDGVFWMPFTSFVKYFECVDICKLRPDWYEVRDSANFYPAPKLMQAFYLTITSVTELDITLHRKISKNLRIQRSEVSLCVAIVSMEEQTNGASRIYSMPMISQRGQHKFVSTDGYLQPGVYVVLPFLFNPVNKHIDNTEFNIALHSSRAIDLERISLPMRIQREFLIKLCIFYGEQVSTSNSSSSDKENHGHGTPSSSSSRAVDGVTIYELKRYWDGLVVLVENRRQSKNVHFHFRCTLSQNAFMSRKDSRHELFDVIPPMHRQIIVTIARKDASHSFTIGHDFQYTLSTQNTIKQGQGAKQRHWPNIDESEQSEDIHLPQSISAAVSNKIS